MSDTHPDGVAATNDAAVFRLMAEGAPVGMIHADHEGTVCWVNDRWRSITGCDHPVPFDYAHVRHLVVADDRSRVTKAQVTAALAVTEFSTDATLERHDGTLVRVRMQGAPVVGPGNTLLGFVGTVADVTAQHDAELLLQQGEERYRRLLEHAPMGCLVTDRWGTIIESNRAIETIFGAPNADVVGHTPWEWVHPDDVPRLGELLDRLWAGDIDRYEAEHRLVLADGGRRWVSVATTIIDGASPGDRNYLVLLQDVTDRKVGEEEQARLAHIVESTSDLVGLVDADTGRLLYLNDHARRVFGLRHRDSSELHFTELYDAESIDTLAAQVLPVLLAGQTWSGEVTMRTAHDEIIHVWQTLTPSHDAAGLISTIAAVGRDVTERRRVEAELSHRALHDSLTGLANRTKLLDVLQAALTDAAAADEQVALFFLDLDRFKQVNDTLGHEAGDELLGEVARRISTILRDGDLVARIGGDEFVLLCPGVHDEGEARELARRVTHAVDSRPITLGTSEVTITASVGIALSSGAGHSEALLRDADAAMYRAKTLGRARLEVFDEGMRRRAIRRTDLADDLLRAVQAGDIEVFYQPCIDLQTGTVREVEALARWSHPELGSLSPSEFIPIAEDTGLIVGLGLQVLTSACRAAIGWLDELGPTAPLVHVNLSARQLATPTLATLVAEVLRSTGLDAHRLCLEITESVLMEDAPTAVRAVEALKSIGVRVAIDDFGTGYSSLSYLSRFPVDLLKVDRSFVDGLGPDPDDSAIVAAIVNLAASLGLEAIAEGVETSQQLELLCQLGCGGAQGFLFSEAVPLTELRPLLQRTWPLPTVGSAAPQPT